MAEDSNLIHTFISYSHDSDLLKRQVLVLADKLNEMGGIDCRLDQYEFPAPPIGWPQWMTYQVDQADYIIMVCTKGYFEKFYRKNKPGTGLGGINECFLITNKFHKMSSASNCFIPVFFADGKEEHIPSLFSGHHHYRLEDKDGFCQARFDELYFHITDQAPTPAPTPVAGIKLRPKVPRGEFPQTPTSSSEEEGDQVSSPSPKMVLSVQGNVAKLLNHDFVKPLLPELKSELETSGPLEPGSDLSATLAAALVHRPLLDGIQALDVSLDICIKALIDSNQKEAVNQLWSKATNILGWLVILSVNEGWVDKHCPLLEIKDLDTRIEIPVATKAGMSITYARMVNQQAQLIVEDGTFDPVGSQDIYLDHLQEGGISPQSNVEEIMAVLYEKIWRSDKRSNLKVPTGKALAIELKRTINTKKKKKEYIGVFVNPGPGGQNPLCAPSIFQELRIVLQELPIFFFKTDSTESALIVTEPDLRSAIQNFFSNQDLLEN